MSTLDLPGLSPARRPARPRSRGRARNAQPWPIGLVPALGALAAVTLLIGLLLAGLILDFVYSGRLYPGVRVLGHDLGGLAPEQAALVLGASEPADLSRPARLSGAGQSWTASLGDLGARLDRGKTAESASRLGRDGTLSHLFAPLRAAIAGWDVDPIVTADPDQRTRVVEYLTAVVDRPVVDARYTLSDNREVVVLPSQIGRRLDPDDLAAQIERVMLGHTGADISLRIAETPPQINEADLQSERSRAEWLLAEPVQITYGAERWTLEPVRLAEMLTLPPGRRGGRESLRLHADRLTAYVEELARSVNRPARDAKFKYAGGRVVVAQESQDGLQVDVAGTVQAIVEAFQRDEHIVPLVAAVDKPARDSSELARIVLRDRLGYGVSYYGGGLPERHQNVELATRRLNGVLVAPGEVFSFNAALGPATIENGFKWGFGIATDDEGRTTTIPSEAGGICQVATTLFQAIFRAGLQIEERNSHTYWIPRYGASETGMIGLDATVDDPNLDLQFRNNTGGWLVITSGTDPGRATIAFEIIGINPGWKVKISDPVITNRKPASTAIVYQESDFLPYGEMWVESAQDGFTAAITRTVIDRDGQTILGPSTFVSAYEPARNIMLVRKRR